MDKDQAIQQAAQEFEENKNLFLQGRNNVHLLKRSEWHYQIKSVPRRWVYNLYPSNQRIYKDPNSPSPFVEVPHPWNLKDVFLVVLKKAEEYDGGCSVNG